VILSMSNIWDMQIALLNKQELETVYLMSNSNNSSDKLYTCNAHFYTFTKGQISHLDPKEIE